MILKHFRIQTTLRVLLLAMTLLAAVYFIMQSFNWLTVIASVSVVVIQLYGLIRYVEKTNRDLARFLEAVKYEDFSPNFSPAGRGKSFADLNVTLTDVFNVLRKARMEKEEQFQYMQTVVEHIGSGVICYQANGDIELINKAAKQILGLTQLKNIHMLTSRSEALVIALLALDAGDRKLVKIAKDGTTLQLAISATTFVMRGQRFTLVSIQDIQHELERERMTRELEIAHQVQMQLLPKLSPDIRGFDLAGMCWPAEEIGGDYFDFIPLNDGRWGIAIGDVSGKGVPAAIYMTLAKGILNANAETQASVKTTLTQVNRWLYKYMERGSFVSMCYAILDPAKSQLIVSRAGHDPLLIIHADGSASSIQPEGMALALVDGDRFNNLLEEKTISLAPGDTLVFYTDGFTEAMNESGEQFGDEQLKRCLQDYRLQPADQIMEKLRNDIKIFADDQPQHDDMTMIVLKCETTDVRRETEKP
ncbi:SpoIIE family protein phosphatase [candidate division KSB1 bacterium]|nr:SpoIIE family protein phosphatase [candidate division KSB1 bacterium]